MLATILFYTFIGSIVSLVGGVLLLLRDGLAAKVAPFLAAFAAGALLSTAFFDLLPEAQAAAGETVIFGYTLLGLLVFFVLERFLVWFHHHHEHQMIEKKHTISLIMIGDTIHNFLDGIAIAATVMVNPTLGLVTTIAVAAHEIPQEIGDFGIMLHRGMSRGKVLWLNVFSACAAFLGAILAFYFGKSIEGFEPIALAITAGFFIYIAASDLIPEIHSEERKRVAFIETVLLLCGVIVVWFLISRFEH